MIKEALSLVQKGKPVYIIVENSAQAKKLEKRVRGNKGTPLIKFETPETVCNLNMRTMTLEDAHPNVEVLVDHFVIENRFRALLNMLHRFDKNDE